MDKLHELVKFTLFDESFKDEALELCTEEHEVKKCCIRSKRDPTVSVNAGTITNTLKKFLVDEGYEINTVLSARRRGKNQINGISVKVSPIGNVYEYGIVVSTVASGDTVDELNANKKQLESALVNTFTDSGIPVDRVCQESLTGCMHKFY